MHLRRTVATLAVGMSSLAAVSALGMTLGASAAFACSSNANNLDIVPYANTANYVIGSNTGCSYQSMKVFDESAAYKGWYRPNNSGNWMTQGIVTAQYLQYTPILYNTSANWTFHDQNVDGNGNILNLAW